MIYFTFSIRQISPERAKKLEKLAWILGPVALAPLLVWGLLDLLNVDAGWLTQYIVSNHDDRGIVTGAYWCVLGAFLLVTRILVGDDAHSIKSNSSGSHYATDQVFGSLVLILNIAGPGLFGAGVFYIALGLMRLLS